MLPKTRVRAVQETGFTLMELLVVILIIGILAAIAVPAFLNQKGKANDVAAKTVARSAETAEEAGFTDGEVYLSQAVGAGAGGALNSIESSLLGPSAACVGTPPYASAPCGLVATGTASGYQVSVSSETGAVFTIDRTASGLLTRTCNVAAAVGDGGCTGVVGDVGSW